MKRILIVIPAIAICAVGLCALAISNSEPKEAVTQITSTNALTSKATTTPTTVEATALSVTTKHTTVRTATTLTEPTTRKSEKELISSVKTKYGIDDSYILTKKTYNNGTEYYWEWVDENGYHNMYDALRVHVKNGKITLKKRFDNKADQGVIAISKSEAIEFAGGGKVTDILYYLNDDMNKPRLSYKIVNGKCITYIDTENCDVLGGDMIK